MPLNRLGLIKTTLIDYPGEVAATLFTPGCNLRCPYCHNPELVHNRDSGGLMPLEEVKLFLEKRRNVLDGVCITGGEPLIHQELPSLIEFVKGLGLKVKLDTNGCYPEKLAAVDVDYIAMDIKTALLNYAVLLGRPEAITSLKKKLLSSINYILSSAISHEFRTTVVPGIVSREDIKEISSLIKGTDRYVLANFQPEKTLDKSYAEKKPFAPDILEEMKKIACGAGIPTIIRRHR